MFDFSPIQIILVLVIALLVFGPRRLPEMGRSLGRGLREFKSAVTGDHGDEPAAPGPAPVAAATAVSADDDELLEGVVVSGDKPAQGS